MNERSSTDIDDINILDEADDKAANTGILKDLKTPSVDVSGIIKPSMHESVSDILGYAAFNDTFDPDQANGHHPGAARRDASDRSHAGEHLPGAARQGANDHSHADGDSPGVEQDDSSYTDDNHSTFRNAVSHIADRGYGINSRVIQEDELPTRTALLAGRHSYYVGKYSYIAGKAVATGTYRFSKHTANLIKDRTQGNITTKEAAAGVLNRGKQSVNASGASIKKIIKHQTIQGIKNFRGSDDIGIQAIVKTNYAYLRTRRIVKTVKAKQKTKYAARTATTVSRRLYYVAKKIVLGAKNIFLKPVMIKSGITAAFVILIAAILMAVITAAASIIPSISLKTDDVELTKTYKYITELDAKFTNKVNLLAQSQNADVIHYYINGIETFGDSMYVLTNADSVLCYFDIKYDDYAFDKFIYGVLGGTNIKSELEALHDALYSITTDQREVVSDDGTEIHLDVYIEIKDFDSYIIEHESELLTPDQKERFRVLSEIGVYTAKKELANPFGDAEYMVSSRFGWNINTLTDELTDHQGIDIPKAEGTEILNVMYGTVITVSSDATRGNYVVIEHRDKRVLYQHMKDVTVSEGQFIERGATIGTVGTTGSSDYPHLHIEYSYKDDILCPSIFIDGIATISGIQPGYASIDGGVGGGNVLAIAASQIGNVGGQPYWSHYGFKNRTAWCAIFVSWCAEKSGYLNASVPKFFLCTNGVDWFLKRGLFRSRTSGYIPKPGDIIFFDFSSRNGSGYNTYGYGADHVGYVESCDGATVYTIEGNTSNSVARRKYSINRSSIVGYGTPVYGVGQE